MLDLLDIIRRIDAGTLTPEAATRLGDTALDGREEEVRAFVHLDREGALLAARQARAPLAGIAVGIKDVIATADMPTEMGSPIYAGWRPKADAAVVAALRGAGAGIIGKTATTPFAFLDPAATRNPRNPAHTPGGSSSGSAAAVAAGMVPLAVGTQTGGSVIRPASYCGVVGVKPSAGLIPTVGALCFSWTLDTLGLFAADVPGAAYALAAITRRPALRIDGRAEGAPRLGVVRQAWAGAPEPASETALAHALQCATAGGAQLRDLTEPAVFAEAFALHATIQDYEARQALAWEWQNHRAMLPPKLAALLDAAQAITPEAYDHALATVQRARAAMRELLADVDALVTFAAPGAAPASLASTGDSRFNRLWTLLGVPCVTVPAVTVGEGLPVGIQIVGGNGRDSNVLAIASFLHNCLRRVA